MTSAIFHRLAAPVLNLVYPLCCPLCGNHGSDCEQHPTHLCRDCLGQLQPQTDSFCRQCGAVLGPYLLDDSHCRHCRNERFAFSEAVALGTYSGALRQACLIGQQPGTADLVEALVSLLWDAHRPRLTEWQIDLVTCIPQHWRKRLGTSINTSAELAARLAHRLQAPFARQLLQKIRHTPDQVQLSSTERRRNLKGAFRVSFSALSRGRRILVVDDVMTTGSTAQACSKALQAGDASEIFVAVVGRGLG